MKWRLLLFLAGALVGSARADRLLESSTARLSSRDHSSSDARLASAAAVVRQDRANFHKFRDYVAVPVKK